MKSLNLNLKNNKGFTLVEVIVVAVIVLILAAVAIPLYQGYMKDARTANAGSAAASAKSMVVAAAQLVEAGGKATMSCPDGIFTVTVTGLAGSSIEKPNTLKVPAGYDLDVRENRIEVSWGDEVLAVQDLEGAGGVSLTNSFENATSLCKGTN